MMLSKPNVWSVDLNELLLCLKCSVGNYYSESIYYCAVYSRKKNRTWVVGSQKNKKRNMCVRRDQTPPSKPNHTQTHTKLGRKPDCNEQNNIQHTTTTTTRKKKRKHKRERDFSYIFYTSLFQSTHTRDTKHTQHTQRHTHTKHMLLLLGLYYCLLIFSSFLHNPT